MTMGLLSAPVPSSVASSPLVWDPNITLIGGTVLFFCVLVLLLLKFNNNSSSNFFGVVWIIVLDLRRCLLLGFTKDDSFSISFVGCCCLLVFPEFAEEEGITLLLLNPRKFLEGWTLSITGRLELTTTFVEVCIPTVREEEGERGRKTVSNRFFLSKTVRPS